MICGETRIDFTEYSICEDKQTNKAWLFPSVTAEGTKGCIRFYVNITVKPMITKLQSVEPQRVRYRVRES